MRRFRIKLIGLGIAALAGSAVASDPDWLPVERAVRAKQSGVVPTGGEPVVLPAAIRYASATEPAAAPDPIWLPAARPVQPPPALGSDTPPQPSPLAEPRVIVVPVEPAANQTPPTRPRVQVVPPQAARETPKYLPPVSIDVPQLPPAPAETWRGAQSGQPKSTSDSPVQPVPPMTPPTLPDSFRPRKSDTLPSPRADGPVAQPAGPTLPVAPPPLMIPDCTPGKHGTFGSPPIRLSRDYPPLSELCGTPIRDWFHSHFSGEREAGSGGFIQGEYLLWWMPGLRIPVLATTSTVPGGNGFIGQPGTVPILGPGTIIDSTRSGFRVRGGLWLDDCGSCGIDSSFFFLGRKTVDQTFTSSQFGTITRPVFSPNIQPGIGVVGETGQAVTVPGVLNGSLSAHAESFLWGADLNIRHCLLSGCDWKLMGFAGFRFLDLSEKLSVTENILVVGTGPGVQLADPIGTVINVRDSFETENRFYGGQVGATYERRSGNWSLDARASVALGVTQQELDINGTQTRLRPGQAPANFRGGLLAAGPNLGHFTRDQFSVVPEATVNLGYWLTDNLRAYVGYNFLYWTNVIRPGDQIDRVVDLSFVPNSPALPPSGQLRPAPQFKQTDLWVTGINFGVEWRW